MEYESDDESLIWSYPSELLWMRDHKAQFDDYLRTCVHYESQEWERKFLGEEEPYLGRKVLKDYITNTENLNTNVNKLLNAIQQPENFVITILGMPGSGKTTTAYKICELLKDKYNIKQVAPLVTDGVLPDWIKWITNVNKAREGDLCLVDEASIKNNARRSMSNQNMEDLGWLAIGRHIGCKIIYMTQISAMADNNITRWTNIFINKGYDTSAVGASEIERKHIGENPILRYLKPKKNYAGIKSERKQWSLVTISGSEFMVFLDKPVFMNEKLSKPYARFIDSISTPEIRHKLDQCVDTFEREEKEMKLIENIAMTWANRMKKDGQSASVIKTELEMRGYRKSLSDWKKFTGELKPRGGTDDFD